MTAGSACSASICGHGINGVQTFPQAMIDQGAPSCDRQHRIEAGHHLPAYRLQRDQGRREGADAEGLAHGLRNVAGCQVTAHLLVPGSTFTGMTARGRTEKPPGAWTPDQVVDMLVERMGAGDFYIICPDNDVTRDIDNRRILWAAEDIIRNRPPLSRWHPDYARRIRRIPGLGSSGAEAAPTTIKRSMWNM